MRALTIRNWKLFYRDRGTVFFSLLGPIIIVALHLFFLKGTVTENLSVTEGSVDYLVDSWVMAGALTVSDLQASLDFYEKVLGITSDGEMSDGAFRRRLLPLPDGSHLGLTQHDARTTALFDPTTPGLDHVGFSCDSRDELSAWAQHLESLGIAHDGVQDAIYGSALSFKDPDGNALEFFAAS